MKSQIFILSFSLSITIFSQFPTGIKPDYIPAVMPMCVLQDSFGFVWIGAQEGLIKYDGYSNKYYRRIPFDSTSLSSNFVTALAEDSIGNLWIGTMGGGLNYFNQKTNSFKHFHQKVNSINSIGSNSITKILVNKDGSLWIATFDNGFTKMEWDENHDPIYTRYSALEKIPPKLTYYGTTDLFKDKRGNLWIGTVGFGLEKLNLKTGKRKSYKHDSNNPNSISHNMISSICDDEDGNLWIGTGHFIFNEGGGLNKFDPVSESFIAFQKNSNISSGLGSNVIRDLHIDSNDGLWIGTFGAGLQYLKLSELKSTDIPRFKNLRGGSVSDVYEDRMKNIWIASSSFYLRKYDYQQNLFPYLKHDPNNKNSLSGNGSRSIFIDSKKNIWIGHSRTGISKYDPFKNTYKFYKHNPNNENSLSSNRIDAICEDGMGNLWIGTSTNGIDILNIKNDSFKHISPIKENSNSLKSNLVRWIIKGVGEYLWIVLDKNGFQKYDLVKQKFYSFDLDSTSIADEEIASICEDSSGTLWIGTFNNGLYRVYFTGNKISQINNFKHNPTNLHSISDNSVYDIIQSKDSSKIILWIATNGGMNRFDTKENRFSHITVKDGLPSNFLLKLIEDLNGDIWFTSTKGISKYSPDFGTLKNYEKEDGLPTTTFGAGRNNVALAKDGTLYFCGGGITIINPKKIVNNPNIPPIRITEFKIFNEPAILDSAIQFKKYIHLSQDQNSFSFKFSALNFTNSGKNQYAYKMEGFHEDWINIGNERTATFTNLDAGDYCFRVRGSNNHGLWNEAGTKLFINISPYWWEKFWFRIISVLVLLLLLFGIHRYRINRRLELENMRIQIASDLHDDVGASLTKIAVHSEIIRSTDDKNKILSSSVKIGSISREIITSLSDIIWSIDARNDKVGDLVDRMRDYIDQVFSPGTVTISFQTKGLKFENLIQQSLRQNIYLIFKEAVNNAAKHSGATELKIRITNRNGCFRLEVCDNGSGINLNQSIKGNHGIENMKLRAERMNGELLIENTEMTKIILMVKEI